MALGDGTDPWADFMRNAQCAGMDMAKARRIANAAWPPVKPSFETWMAEELGSSHWHTAVRWTKATREKFDVRLTPAELEAYKAQYEEEWPS